MRDNHEGFVEFAAPNCTRNRAMKTIKASEFKDKCLRLMDEVADTGARGIITKNGRPVAQLGPVVSRPATLAGAHRGKIAIVGDILSPVDAEWDAAR